MALTSAQQKSMFKLTVGLFNAAPGGFYAEVEGILGAVSSEAAVANILMKTSAFQAILPTNVLTNEQFAKNFLAKLVGNYVSVADQKFASDLMIAQLNGGASQGAVAWWAIDELSKVPASNTVWGKAAAAFNNKVEVSTFFTVEKFNSSQDIAVLQGLLIDVTDSSSSVAVAKANGVMNNISLTTNVETTLGTADADLFIAQIRDNANTLQSGDTIKGGAGMDTLFADIASSQKFAIAANTTGVETIKIQVQADAEGDVHDNNTHANKVEIDAQRMENVQVWHNTNSRADLIIEDVRIADGAKTKDVTIVMESTDPGNVDFGVYFDQHSLRNSSTGNTSLAIKLMDTGAAGAAATADKPLLNNPYDQFKLGVNGQLVTIQLDKTAVAAADTYEALLAVFQTAVQGAGVSVAFGPSFTVTDPISNTQVTGKSIVLTGVQGTVISAPAGSGWYNTTSAAVPPTSNIYTTYQDAASSTTELVTSTIVLDDVGRGSTGGDLVVGGLSVGQTSTSRGVERFEIEVRDNSKLQTINSTNDALREVVLKNGKTTNTTSNTGAYDVPVTDKGNLSVMGGDYQVALPSVGGNNVLPGLDGDTTGKQIDVHHGAYGFTNVRLIDASVFAGKFAFDAQITKAAIDKYITQVDTQASPTGDVAGAGNTNFNVKGANFLYTGGTNDDTMIVDIDGGVAASRSSVVTGQSDFTFTVNGGAGNDTLTVNLAKGVDATQAGGGVVTAATLTGANGAAQEAWYLNQQLNKNAVIDGGDGNDTIHKPGAGDATILAGAGNDVVYAENTGALYVNSVGNATSAAVLDVTANAPVAGATGKAAFVFNTAKQDTALATDLARNVSDLISDTNETYNVFKGEITVTYKGAVVGLSSKVVLANNSTYTTTDLEINQAIKQAINSDTVLSKLLVAKDGPANTLVVESLIDGANAAADLSVAFALPTLATLNALSATELSAVAKAYGATTPGGVTGANLLAFMTDGAAVATIPAAAAKSFNAFGTNGDYVTQLGNDGIDTATTGANSTKVSDNVITGGAGNDIIVLGTTVGANALVSSNDKVVFGAAFDNDTIVNYTRGGNGADILDFSAVRGSGTLVVTGVAAGAGNPLGAVDGGQINIAAVATGATGNDTIAGVKAQFTDGVVAATQLYFSVDASNVASVYQVVDGTAAADLAVTLLGTVDLVGTAWSTMTAADFA